jgi:glycosyltransferase involved in cell wall biosynthesis
MTKILLLYRAAIGPQMASPGVRAYQLAGALARRLPQAEVTLAIPENRGEFPLPAPNVRLQPFRSNGDALVLARNHDISIARDFPPRFALLMGDRRFALDAFTPFFVEWMELSKRDVTPRWRRTRMASNRWYLNFQLTLADFIFCADDRQRDLWIGMLMALALVPPDVYERDPSLRRFVDLVPYGVPSRPLQRRERVMKGVIAGIKETDKVLLWNGSVTDWNDPLTLLRAMEHFSARRPDIHLVFMGSDHPDFVFGPNAGVLRRAIEMSKEMGLYGRNVHFLQGWVPYEQIDDYLAEADASVCLGYENIESRFAFRTRYVDLFRARVPLLCTRGDVLADRVGEDPLGITVPELQVEPVIEGIERLLGDGEFVAACKQNLAAIGDELAWDLVVEPLAQFCASGESFATPAPRRRLQAYTRAGAYFAMKKICKVKQGD